jgi:hypothetical protein
MSFPAGHSKMNVVQMLSHFQTKYEMNKGTIWVLHPPKGVATLT